MTGDDRRRRAALRAWLAGQSPPPGTPPVDPLRNRVAALTVTLVVAATAVLSLTLSVASGVPRQLPAVALASPALFHLQRALVATLGIALLAVFIVRAAFGYFPVKVGTSGAEWDAAVAVARKELASSRTDEDLAASVAALRGAHGRHEQQTSADIERLAAAIAAHGRALVALERAITVHVPGSEEAMRTEWERLKGARSGD